MLLGGARRPAAPLLLRRVLYPGAADHVGTRRPYPWLCGDELLLLHGAVGTVFARSPSFALDRLRGGRGDGTGGGGRSRGTHGGGVQQWWRRRVHLELHTGEGAPADRVKDRRRAHVHVGHGANDGVHPGQRGRAMLPAAAAAEGPVVLLLLLVE
uniref:Uncharacterized protein n=1 Tax=Zea mays TaxID=4577 RepID=C4IYY9_MAIZE|nr:unknown [Zea mays]